MFLTGEKKVPALLKAKVAIEDSATLSLTKGIKRGYMVKDEYDNQLEKMAVKVFPSESSAKSYGQGQDIIKVDITWIP